MGKEQLYEATLIGKPNKVKDERVNFGDVDADPFTVFKNGVPVVVTESQATFLATCKDPKGRKQRFRIEPIEGKKEPVEKVKKNIVKIKK